MTRKFTKLLSAALMSFTASTVLALDVNPTTAPASVNTAAPVFKHAPRVEVLPFTAVSAPPAGQDWTGRGIQEDLQSDVSRTGATLVLPPHPSAPGEDPIAVARQDHADLAVTGSYQIVDNQIRANGHLIDVATNTPVGGFSATGNQHDLFKVEDALGEQLRALLPRQMTADQVRQAFGQAESSPDYQQPTPSYVEPAPTVNNYYDTTPVTPDYGYYYPDYSYGYGYPYGFNDGFIYVTPGFGFFNGGRDFDRGFHDRGFGDRGGHFGSTPAFRGGGGVGHGGGFGGGFGGGRGGGGGGRR